VLKSRCKYRETPGADNGKDEDADTDVFGNSGFYNESNLPRENKSGTVPHCSI
jgi:hypothetical protein